MSCEFDVSEKNARKIYSAGCRIRTRDLLITNYRWTSNINDLKVGQVQYLAEFC